MIELVDYRVSYGECAGYCTSVLTIDGTEMELVQTSNDAGESSRRYRGSIEDELAEKIRHAAAASGVQPVGRVYGDPDAHDEGAVTIRLRGSTGITECIYSRGSPPDELAALDALLSPIVLGWIDGDSPDGVSFIESS